MRPGNERTARRSPTKDWLPFLGHLSSLTSLLLLLLCTLCCLPTSTWAALSDKRLCADPKCEQIISTGIAKISYLSGGDGLIPFKINAPIRVLSKSAGTNRQLWGVEIGGRRGYANKDFIMEKKVLVREKDLLYEVPVGATAAPQVVLNASESGEDVASTTTSPLEVKVESIVVDKTEESGQEAPLQPTTASQSEPVLVDGTALPLEAVPAVTEPQIVVSEATTAAEAPLEASQQGTEAKILASEPQEAEIPIPKPQAAEIPTPKPQEPVIPTPKPQDVKQGEEKDELDDFQDDFDYEGEEEDEADEADDSDNDDTDNETLNVPANDKKSINISESIEVPAASQEPEEPKNVQLELDEKEDNATEVTENAAEAIIKPIEATGLPEAAKGDSSVEVEQEITTADPAIEKSADNAAATATATATASVATEAPSVPPVEAAAALEPEPPVVQPVGLPPLFEKKNFENPNDYYKQLQEQQELLKSVSEEATEQPKQPDEPAYKQPEPEVQYQDHEDYYPTESSYHYHSVSAEETTPSAFTESAYASVYDEATPAPDSPYRAAYEEATPAPESPYRTAYEEATPAPEQQPESAGVGTVEPVQPVQPVQPVEPVEPMALPSTESPVKEDGGVGFGLFATIVDTVNNFIGKEPQPDADGGDELQRILYPHRTGEAGGSPKSNPDPIPADVDGYCARVQPQGEHCHRSVSLDNFVEVLAGNMVDHSLLLLCVVIAAASSLFFLFTYYCFCNSSKEGELLSKLNHLERSLLASHKENLIVKHDLMTTRQKLASIEDNSFGSNDMVADLKQQLERELYEKAKLQEQVLSLEQDLDNAADAGLELDKMLKEVMASQNLSTMEEQEKIILEINSSLAEKSRENSELQYSYTEATKRFDGELKSLQEDNYELEMEKEKLQSRLEEIEAETEREMAKALEARNIEMQRLQKQILDLTAKWEREHGDLQTSQAKIEALEDCLKSLKKDANLNVQELITSAKTRGELKASHKKFVELQVKLEEEVALKQRLENQLQQSSADVEQLKQDYNQSERDKLEAQNRLQVLSGYFRDKENELKKELSQQETKWLQHQGENASTVETQTLMKNEIQTLKSQNDELRAEIEAQIASHKAQMGTLENRAHESWLAARQSERRCEEALAEAAGLRRRLTTMAGGEMVGAVGAVDAASAANGAPILGVELKTAPSPLPLPGSPLLNMPNPLPFLPAPFSPFMGLPPFLPGAPSGGARPPPLGRMRSPPPRDRERDRDRDRDRDRYSDYSDYDDYDDEEEDDRGMNRRRRHSGSWGRRGHRDSYTHSPRTYRSLSPSDSRYNYNDTETEYSPPPSPPPATSAGRNGGTGSRPYSEV